MKLLYFISSMTLLTPLAEAQVPFEILNSAYQQATDLMQEFPPDEYFIINWGESMALPDLIMVEIVGDAKKADHYVQYWPIQWFKAQSTTVQEEFLRKMLPSAQELGNRKIVINRNLYYGQTAAGAFQGLAKILKEKGHSEAILNYFALETTLSETAREHQLWRSNEVTDLELRLNSKVVAEKDLLYWAASTDFSHKYKIRQGRLKPQTLGSFDGVFTPQKSPLLSDVKRVVRQKGIPNTLGNLLKDRILRPVIRSSKALGRCIFEVISNR